MYRAATNTHLLTEREKNKQTLISLLFNRLLYVTFLYEIKEGRETFPTHLFDFVLFSSVDFTCCSWNLWNLETMYSRSLNYSRRGISDPNSWLRYPLIFSPYPQLSLRSLPLAPNVWNIDSSYRYIHVIRTLITPHLSCSTKSRYPPSTVLSLQRY